MTLPPLQFSSTAASSGKSGDLSNSVNFDHSGFAVNYGNGVTQGAGSAAAAAKAPYAMLAIAGAVGFWLWKKYK